MKLHEMTLNDFNESLFATNGAPALIETRELAEYAKNLVDNNGLVAVMPGDDDFADICAKLDLTDANSPQRVFKIVDAKNAVVGYIAFTDDWELA